MTRVTAAATALALLMPLPLAAGNLFNQNFTLPVVSLGPDTFEVIEADGAGGTQIWCGAGIYVRHVLGQRGGDITIQQSRGDSVSQPGRKSVVFTTASVPDAFNSIDQGVRRDGKRFSAGHAFALCSSLNRLKLRLQDGSIVRRGI